MRSVTISAPGKLMIMGEHAVLYGERCIVTAVEQRLQATLTCIADPVLEIEAPDVQLTEYTRSLSSLNQGVVPKGARFIEQAVLAIHTAHPLPWGIRIETASDFSSLMGFGSSSASTVCVVKGLYSLLGIEHTDQDVFSAAFQAVRAVQGIASGFDIAAAVFGGTCVYSMKEGMTQRLPRLPLVIGYSGQKADTVSMIEAVKKRLLTDAHLQQIFPRIGGLVAEALNACEMLDLSAIGALMNANHELLKELGVSTPTLDAMIAGALHAGSLGAKLSGAGGGDCMIALVPDARRQDVLHAIERAGGKCIDIPTHAQGCTVVHSAL